MAYFKPIVSYGRYRDVAFEVDSEPADGDTTLVFDNELGYYAVAEFVFVGESDYTYPQFLGSIKSVAADGLSLVTEMAVERDYGAGARIWKPAQSFRFTKGPGFNVIWGFDPSVSVRRSPTNEIFATKVNPKDAHSVSLFWKGDRGDPGDWWDYQDFLTNYRRSGLDPFALSLWQHGRDRSVVLEVQQVFEDRLEEKGDRGMKLSTDPAGKSEYRLDFFIREFGADVSS